MGRSRILGNDGPCRLNRRHQDGLICLLQPECDRVERQLTSPGTTRTSSGRSATRPTYDFRFSMTEAGLAAFVKTSGGKGLHVVAPLKPHATWPEVKAFTKAMAEAMAADAPGDYVATIAKAQRKGRILIDYLRNQRGATAVAAYSPRARLGAAISTPLTWEELRPEIGPAHFTLTNLPARLAAQDANPWDGFRKAAAPLKVLKR